MGEITRVVSDFVKVTFGSGFAVKHVRTGFQSCVMILSNLPSGVTLSDVTPLLEPFGVLHKTKLRPTQLGPKQTKRTELVAVYENTKDASRAVSALDGSMHFGRTIAARVDTYSGGHLEDTCISLEWPAAQKTVYLGYSTLKSAQKAMTALDGMEWKGAWLTAQKHTGLPSVGAYTIRISGLPPSAKTKDQKLFGKPEGSSTERAKYDSHENAVQGITKLVRQWRSFQSIDVQPGPYKDGIVRAIVRFGSTKDARTAAAALEGSCHNFLGSAILHASHMQYVLHTLPYMSFRLLRADIVTLQEACSQTGEARLFIENADESNSTIHSVTIRLVGTNAQNLGRVNSQMNALLLGETVRHEGRIIWDDFFSTHPGRHFLYSLGEDTQLVQIQVDGLRRTVSLFGSAAERRKIAPKVIAKVTELQACARHVLTLTGRLVGLLMSEELFSLQQRLGSKNVDFDVKSRQLVIRGDDEALELVRVALLKAEVQYPAPPRSDRVECPACFNEVAFPVKLECGHSWCKPCLADYLTSAATDHKLFPLTCIGREAQCDCVVPLATAQDVLSTSQFEDVAHAAFMAHVHARPDELRFCPTPECAQVYRPAPPNAEPLQCPSCLVRICASCSVEQHAGVRCEERAETQEQLFRLWEAAHDVKRCPGCKVPIERESGCHHMTCTVCHTHICWVCTKTFPGGKGIYEHMRSMHGGIGL
jgi:hypothetical protein